MLPRSADCPPSADWHDSAYRNVNVIMGFWVQTVSEVAVRAQALDLAHIQGPGLSSSALCCAISRQFKLDREIGMLLLGLIVSWRTFSALGHAQVSAIVFSYLFLFTAQLRGLWGRQPQFCSCPLRPSFGQAVQIEPKPLTFCAGAAWGGKSQHMQVCYCAACAACAG